MIIMVNDNPVAHQKNKRTYPPRWQTDLSEPFLGGNHINNDKLSKGSLFPKRTIVRRIFV